MQVVLRPWSFADVNDLSTLADNRKIWDNVGVIIFPILIPG